LDKSSMVIFLNEKELFRDMVMFEICLSIGTPHRHASIYMRMNCPQPCYV